MPPSWICDVTSGRHLGFVTSFRVAILDFRSRDFLTGSHVTGNPRWRPEMTSQIQDGGRKWRHKSKMAAILYSSSHSKTPPRVWQKGAMTKKSVSNSFWWISFKFGRDRLDIQTNQISNNQTELKILTTPNVRSDSPLAQVGQKTMWPGDRRAVEWGQHLGTWWLCSSFFFFFFFLIVLYGTCKLSYSTMS